MGFEFQDELEGCTDAERSKATTREAALQIWHWSQALARQSGKDKSTVSREVLSYLHALAIPVSIKTLYSWDRAYRDKGILGLVDLRSRSDRPKYKKFFAELALVYQTKFVTSEVAHYLVKDNPNSKGWAIPTIRESIQYLKRHVRPGVTTERGGQG
jgi:transposase